MINTRFAPAASGKLHLGNLRVLLVNYMLCCLFKLERVMLLRIDFQADTTEKDEDSLIESVKSIVDIFDLDIKLEISTQRSRFNRYFEVFEILKNKGLVYLLNDVYYLNIKLLYEDKIHIVRFNDLLLGKMYKSASFINNPVICVLLLLPVINQIINKQTTLENYN